MGRAAGVIFSLTSWFNKYETAPYTVVGPGEEEAGWEERLYPARNWVCTARQEENNPRGQRSGMFWALFQYIQGGNEDGVKIDMTTPVTTLRSPDGGLEMCFYLGAEHQAAPPAPTQQGVFIKARYIHSLI